VSISSEAKADIKAAQKVRLPWWALVFIGVLSLPIFWLFDHFGSLGISLPVLDSIIALGFVLYVKRRLSRHWWFWMIMAVIAALHVLLIWSIPWTEGWKPAAVAGVLVSADICLILWIVAAVESIFARRAAAH
jgi:magnesium-transporting ATPase (P-type)